MNLINNWFPSRRKQKAGLFARKDMQRTTQFKEGVLAYKIETN